MVATGKIVNRDVIIKNELGLHARSAAQIAKLVRHSKAKVWIKKGDEKVDASSIVDILTLACEKGTTITIIIEDSSDIAILNAVAELVESEFRE
jgi:phosphocarrier protein